MRDYGRVYSSFWQSPDCRTLTEDARTLALYLLTCPHATLIGCYRLPDAYAADDLQWSSERVREGFAKLSESGFVVRDDATQWVLVAKYLKWNQFENPNVARAAVKAFDQVPEGRVKWLIAKALCEFAQHLPAEFKEACATLPEPFGNPSRIQNQNQNQSQNQNQNREPEPNTKTPRKRGAASRLVSASDLEAKGVDPQHAADWLAVRAGKRLPLTGTALERIEAEAVTAGITLAAAVHRAAANGWAGFSAKWPVDDAGRATVIPMSQGVNRQEALERRNRAVAEAWAKGNGS